MTVRLIDLDSIRKNPHAGQTQFPVAGKRETHVEEDGTIISRRDVVFMHSIYPSPQQLFRYEPMDVECQYCHAVFPVDDLGEDSVWDDAGDTMICDICPKCRNSDCVEERIEYETIEAALKRKGDV